MAFPDFKHLVQTANQNRKPFTLTQKRRRALAATARLANDRLLRALEANPAISQDADLRLAMEDVAELADALTATVHAYPAKDTRSERVNRAVAAAYSATR